MFLKSAARSAACAALATALSAGARSAAIAATKAGSAAAANQWVKLEQAEVKRRDAPLIYEPDLRRFMVLGGSISYTEYPKPHPFDELALDLDKGEWENWFPPGKDWGPRFGDCTPPGWKDGYWKLLDVDGNCRPNLITSEAMGIGYYGHYAFDPDTGRTWFYAHESTFCYDAAARTWKDVAPPSAKGTGTLTAGSPSPLPAHPAQIGGSLCWGAMCYVPSIKKVLLFGGGNVRTERGDPGTWTYDPATNAWEALKLDKQPPQRALAPMVYDPVAQKVVLFGGDRLDQLQSDTWTFDGAKWEERKPAIAPAPRAGHALVWLPKARKVLLLGGYAYASGGGYYPAMYRSRPLEAWTYDAAADRWDLVAAWDKEGPASSTGPAFLRAAADEDDHVLVLSNGTWFCRLDVSKPDAEKTGKVGVTSGAVERRTGFYDPAWYRTKGPPPDAATTEAELAALSANTWVQRSTPNRPDIEANEGSAVFVPELDLLINYQGGHCCYGGTAPLVYRPGIDRWSIPFAPEMYLNFCASNMGLLDGWSFARRPWMPGHPYKSIGYEPQSKSMIYVSTAHTFFFDPARGEWSRLPKPNPFTSNQHVTSFVTTPKGVVGWVGYPGRTQSLFLLDPGTHEWRPLPLTSPLPTASWHDHSMVYDAKRDRILLFAGLDKRKGDVAAYDPKSGAVTWLNAAGKGAIAAAAGNRTLYFQETPHLADQDLVFAGLFRVPGEGGKMLCPIYDCEKNAWFGAEFAGADPIGKSTNSYFGGVVYDPKRKLVWAVDHISHIFVLKVDVRTAKLTPL
jgi:hypothetical protein